MKISYAADSRGNTVAVHSNLNLSNNLSVKTRLFETQTFLNEIIPFFCTVKINVSNKMFDFMIQPLYAEDCLLFFTKTMLASDSEEVKLSNSLKNKPDFVFKNRDEENRLKSIFGTEEKGKRVWWLLSAEKLVVKRNLYDGKRIDLIHSVPVPYYCFAKELERMVIRQTDMENSVFCNKYRLFGSSERNYFNVPEILDTAIIRSGDFDGRIEYIIKKYKDMTGISDRDIFSNRKNLCLWLINNRKADNVFENFTEIKLFLRQNLTKGMSVYYKNNAIILNDGANRKIIYVCRSFNDSVRHWYVVGGHIYYSVAELEKAIISSDCFIKNQWYVEGVMPYIQKENKAKSRTGKKDEIGWNKRKRNGKE